MRRLFFTLLWEWCFNGCTSMELQRWDGFLSVFLSSLACTSQSITCIFTTICYDTRKLVSVLNCSIIMSLTTPATWEECALKSLIFTKNGRRGIGFVLTTTTSSDSTRSSVWWYAFLFSTTPSTPRQASYSFCSCCKLLDFRLQDPTTKDGDTAADFFFSWSSFFSSPPC